ncbi:hypothetical protein [Nonomuraea africana]|uniref:Uncharacterized protein n=1 Tax=Nonomuraea africana TaxID=46171 RepID=A0ABR9KBE9_9ACTN|nr:hypothetical protein [Nonomuraea africana]MBE1559338.1 hypothetical protein [Nonomuraea africana]
MSEPPLTQAQALARVDRLVHDTAAALTPKPRLELVASSVPFSACLDGGKSESQIVINRAYWLRDLPKSENMSIARQVRAFWERQGHVITSTGGWQVGHPSIGGESRPDGFVLALTWSAGDDLYLAATSPCVWPDDTIGTASGART